MAEGWDRQYLAFLAIEHVRHGDLAPLLDGKTLAFVHAFARDLKLEEFLAPGAMACAHSMSRASSSSQPPVGSCLGLEPDA